MINKYFIVFYILIFWSPICVGFHRGHHQQVDRLFHRLFVDIRHGAGASLWQHDRPLSGPTQRDADVSDTTWAWLWPQTILQLWKRHLLWIFARHGAGRLATETACHLQVRLNELQHEGQHHVHLNSLRSCLVFSHIVCALWMNCEVFRAGSNPSSVMWDTVLS